MGSGAGWEATRRSRILDLAVAAALGVVAAVSLYIGGDRALFGDNADYSRPVGIGITAALVVAVGIRRIFPLVGLTLATAVFVPLRTLEVPEYAVSAVIYFVVLYSAGAYGGRRRHLVRGAAAVVILGLVAWSIAYQTDGYPGRVPLELVNALTAAQNVVYLAGAWMLGDLVHARRRREAVLEEQAEALRQAQADGARRAVLHERLRIARELHDVVAHHVSVMGVQAGAARRMLDRRPETVPDLLSSVEESSRQAVSELQGMLTLLRREVDDGNADSVAGRADGHAEAEPSPLAEPAAGGGAARSPQPTLARLDVLVGQMRDAGLRVELRSDDAGPGLPLGVDLAAYRIIQEALTNTLKHAGVTAASEVAVTRHPDALEVLVVDDGAGPGHDLSEPAAPTDPGTAPAPPPEGTGSRRGHGIVGMRERVRMLGGELRTQRRAGGGFEVRAWLPLDTAQVRR